MQVNSCVILYILCCILQEYDNLDAVIKELAVPEPLPLLVVEGENITQALLVSGKQKIVSCEHSLGQKFINLSEAILTLIATYYVLDINFPASIPCLSLLDDILITKKVSIKKIKYRRFVSNILNELE